MVVARVSAIRLNTVVVAVVLLLLHLQLFGARCSDNWPIAAANPRVITKNRDFDLFVYSTCCHRSCHRHSCSLFSDSHFESLSACLTFTCHRLILGNRNTLEQTSKNHCSTQFRESLLIDVKLTRKPRTAKHSRISLWDEKNLFVLQPSITF